METSTEILALSASKNTPNTTVDTHKEFMDLCKSLQYYVLIVVGVIGFVGNTLSFVIFLRSKLKNVSVRIYLLMIALADNLMLILDVTVKSRVVNYSNILCTGLYYMRNCTRMFEAFLVVILCVDRLVMLLYPIKYKITAKPSQAAVIVLANLILSATLTSYSAFTYRIVEGNICNINAYLQKIFFLTEAIFGRIIGEVLVSIVLAVVALKIKTTLTQRKRQNSNVSEQCRSIINGVVCKVTVIVAVTFIISRLSFSLVYVVYIVRYYLMKLGHDVHYFRLTIATIVLQVTANLNYCINIFIYILYWPSFKHGLIALLSCRTEKKEPVEKERVQILTPLNKDEQQKSDTTESALF